MIGDSPRLILLPLAWALLCLSACGPKVPSLHKFASISHEKACRVAVLPFVNETDYPLADLIFYRIFLSELVQTGLFDVAQEGDIREAINDLKIRPGQRSTVEQVNILGDRLGVGVVITGTVVEMSERRTARSLDPIAAISLDILDAGSGRRLWTTYHRREGRRYRKVMHYGMLNTASSLAGRVSEEVLKLWVEQGFRGCVY